MSILLLKMQHLTFFFADIFKFDPNYLDNEEKYKEIKNEILGEDEDEEDGSEEDSEDENEG